METEDKPPAELKWWRPVDINKVSIKLDNTAHPYIGVVHWLTVTAADGQFKFVPSGIYWLGADIRVPRAEAPPVGEWELVTAPGEDIDWSDLGKLLDDGQPSQDNGEGIADEGARS